MAYEALSAFLKNLMSHTGLAHGEVSPPLYSKQTLW
jgi:hypothetical protein